MSHFGSFLRTGAFLLGTTVLVACDTAEERAEGFYAKGVELVAAGEIDKAILEFRNALQINQDLVPPRLEFAKALLIKQDYQSAVGHFLRVVELAPENVEARKNLGEILLAANNVEQAMVHINAAYEIEPENTDIQGLRASGLFRQDRVPEAVELSRAILAKDAKSIPAAMVLIGERLAVEDFAGALGHADTAVAASPDDLGLQLTKLQLLERAGRNKEIGEQLAEMRRLFPENRSVATALIQWLVSQEQIDEAEAELRTIATDLADRDASTTLFRFLRQYRGDETARDYLEGLARGTSDRAFYLRALSSFDYQLGNPQDAIARMNELLTTDLEPIELNETKMTLADLYRRTGQTAEARALFDQVLEEDPENVDGLRLRALNALDEDRPEDAINDLRSALNQDPENAALMTILATAHERNGSADLALDRLSLAVKASNYGVEQIQRYASFLVKQDQTDNAVTVLRDGLRRNPNAPGLLADLGRLYLQQQNWRLAEEMAAALEALDSPEAITTATGIRVAAASGQENFDQSIGLLRNVWAQSGEATTAMENLVRTYVVAGDSDKALSFLDDIIAEDPKNMRATLLKGAVRAIQGETGMAEALYRKVITDFPEAENGYNALSALLDRLGRRDEADAIRREGLENAPDSARLLLAQAARHEINAEFEEAIAIYELLYERNPNAELLANNLASLLSDHRDDAESKERAFAIAKRLRTSDVPAYQDTFGWLLYNRGEYERALGVLRRAQEGLSNNPIVNYHLGMTLKELDNATEAKRYLRLAVEQGEGLDLPQIADAAAALAQLEAQ